MTLKEMVKKIRQGDERTVGRALTSIENGDPAAVPLLYRLKEFEGKALRVGITGPMGCGKSTLISALTGKIRKEGKKVAILAIDPASPLSGGAFLGDRIRMRQYDQDKGVFIRSLSNKGRAGGIAPGLSNMMRLLDAMGSDIILIETIGAGQNDVMIRTLVHRVILVLMPGLGDDIQALKGGLFEIADFLVLNKSDLPGADQQMDILKETLYQSRRKKPLLFKTDSLRQKGISTLCHEILETAREK
ncbi:MAG: methylmalonyl Co-A mutase-associated GTPase MeaB [Nitrospirae bacterium]|nr:methylmalonyl Co-A mutase-associated GTPase MeaB [Nitrospirota bacterium]